MELTPARTQTLFPPAPSKHQVLPLAALGRLVHLLERWYGGNAASLALYH
ncbi:MAG TPA: hypothetical protein VM074_03395 [Solimonas sp.]|nr:hypothetical protein [Solimonas sp.]